MESALQNLVADHVLKLRRISPTTSLDQSRAVSKAMTPFIKQNMRRLKLVADTPAHPLIQKRTTSPIVLNAKRFKLA